MNRKILLVGGGGHCKSVLDTLLMDESYSEIGIIDIKENIGKKILDVSIIGSDDDLENLVLEGFCEGFITLGSVGVPCFRRKLFKQMKNLGYHIPNIIDLSANVSNHVKLAEGIFIGKNTVINAGAEIRDGAIINTGAIVEHDCLVGSFAHIASGTVLGGGVIIGKNTHIGSNSVVKQQLKIGSDTIIGMGSVVTKNIESNSLAYGNPCTKVVKK